MMLMLLETYPWDEVFDGDKSHDPSGIRWMSCDALVKLHEHVVRMATPDNHWSDDVKHRGGQDE